MFRHFLTLFVVVSSFLEADSLFQPSNTTFTTLFRTDWGTIGSTSPLPAMLMLARSETYDGDWHVAVSAGLEGRRDFSESGFLLNCLEATRYVGDHEFTLGKRVEAVGVMDLLSVTNILNPIRTPFFDDPDPEIRRIPQWMAVADLALAEETRLRFILEPFDHRYQDYTDTYLSLALDTLVPALVSDYRLDDPFWEAAKTQIFLPAYRNGIAPAVKNAIGSYYDVDDLSIDKLLVGMKLERRLEETLLGFAWFNKYSEIPYIEADPHLVSALLDNPNAWKHLQDYLGQNDLSLIEGVEGFRYNQLMLYTEGVAGEFGVRAEAFWRDRIPYLAGYSSLYGAAVGIDHHSTQLFQELEVQWLGMGRSGENLFAAVWALRGEPMLRGRFAARFEHYTILGGVEGKSRLSLLPTLVLSYRERIALRLQYLLYPDDRTLDTFVTTLEVRF
ncbi:hypothetical protein [Hydrogenimonas sp.]